MQNIQKVSSLELDNIFFDKDFTLRMQKYRNLIFLQLITTFIDYV